MPTTTRKLRLVFKDANDEKVSQTWNNIKANPTRTEVKNFMTGIITNKTIFSKAPAVEVSAETVVTTTTPIDISD